MSPLHGLVLAAGAGRRLGRPKALIRDASGRPWLHTAVAALRGAGADLPVTVVLGAGAREAAELVPPGVLVVVAPDWADGMGASLRTGLTAVAGSDPVAVVVTLVDLPDVGPDVVARLVARALGPDTLARAAYDGRPGHPVLLGRGHLPGVVAAAVGDRGARDHLAAHPHVLVECGDLATGRDVDEGPVA